MATLLAQGGHFFVAVRPYTLRDRAAIVEQDRESESGGLHTNAAWPAGEYRYTVELDGRNVTCTGSLPLQPCARPSITCDGEGVSITESGCALEPDQQAFGGISIDELPKNVHLRIEHDGLALVDQDLTADYTVSQPNGPDCGPVCCSASDALVLSFDRAP